MTRKELTLFLSSDVILDVLAYLKTKPTAAEVGLDVYASSVLDWAIDGDDSSVHPNRYSELITYRNNAPHSLLNYITFMCKILNRWPVPKAKYYPPQLISGEFRHTKHTKYGKRSERIRPPKLKIINGMKCWDLQKSADRCHLLCWSAVAVS